ncbi:hypothetical protein domain protein [Microcystis aeruginosa TAIHU98]|uniref:Uncharacterized protein n=1 Tax=Microcystis aeruginosa TAIHU98 TaxID=1134457 RepID=L7E7D0_MICAE|nr:hypothetical protein domain protein [Microcystis aeruginosa TAIHU98]ROH92931.1 hypothetical protein ED562_23395 [Microcystis aeruginosa FACHB-524]
MVGTFSGKKSLKALSNKVFRFIQQTLINQRLTIVLRDCTKALKTGAIVSVTDRIFRIRLLSI